MSTAFRWPACTPDVDSRYIVFSAQCPQCGRFVRPESVHLSYAIGGPGVNRVSGTCKRCGPQESLEHDGMWEGDCL